MQSEDIRLSKDKEINNKFAIIHVLVFFKYLCMNGGVFYLNNYGI